jgi:hypothetical protein
MLERLVKPILEAWIALKIADDKVGECATKIDKLKKECEKAISPLQKELGKSQDEAHMLREKQLDLRRDLGKKLRETNCAMTTVKVTMDGETKTYGVCDSTGTAMIYEIADTKDVEKLMTINKMSNKEGKLGQGI